DSFARTLETGAVDLAVTGKASVRQSNSTNSVSLIALTVASGQNSISTVILAPGCSSIPDERLLPFIRMYWLFNAVIIDPSSIALFMGFVTVTVSVLQSSG